jgi:Domain of unknown function (DUF5916)
MTTRSILIIAGALLLQALQLSMPSGSVWALQAVPTTAKIVVDGRLDEPDWLRAPVFDTFTENTPNEKVPARFKSEVRVLYDKDAIYFGLRAHDPDTSKIYAPFVRRDKVYGAQDNFVIWIDPTGARKFAQFFRLNTRGILGDGSWNEDTLDETFAPDYDFEAVPHIDKDGWSAEFRIPWASLRLPHPAPEKLTFIVFRNAPRETRIRMSTAVLGRDPPCFLCVADELTGIRDLPRLSGLTVTPFVSANTSQSKQDSDAVRENKFSAGADIKWRPHSDWVVDGTFRPDFSQLELDTPQLKSNTRFAIFVPEKRPFFLEGTDLYSVPYDMVYTRSITDPLWGARATYRSARTDGTILTVADRGGGFTFLPGTYASDAREQGRSQATLARVRTPYQAFGGSGSIGALLADRSYDDGVSNRVASVDGLFKPSEETRLRTQLSASDTNDVNAGGHSRGHLLYVDGFTDNGVRRYNFNYQEISPHFRADNSLITQNGYRALTGEAFYCLKPEKHFFNSVCPNVNVSEKRTWDGTPLQRWITPGIFASGGRNSEWNIQPRMINYRRVAEGGKWHHTPTLYARAEGNPGERISYAFIETEYGRSIDVATDTLARFMFTAVNTTLRPHERIEFELSASDYRLHDLNTSRWRLQERTAQWVAIGYISALDTARLIAQHTMSKRNPVIYAFAVTPRAQTQALSLVYTHKRGLGREFNLGATRSTEIATGSSKRVTTEFFAKMSWAVSL